MDRHALEVLQFRDALAMVARRASSPLGREAVQALTPSASPDTVDAELRYVDQMAAFLLRNEDWFIPAVPDLRMPLRRLAVEGSVWEPLWLRDAGVLLASARQVRESISRDGGEHRLLSALTAGLARLDDQARRIEAVVDEAGEVRDTASRELARLRRELRAARSSIVQRLEQFAAGLPDWVRVSDGSVSLREGRYVVPIRAAGRAEVGGIVHDESASGATLFVEPPIALELMNRLRALELAEAREVQRILRETTELLRPHQGPLQATLDSLIELDCLFARGRYALACNGRRPELTNRDYEVVGGRHPLLLEGSGHVVPFDLQLEPEERTLLVSGPNTGGKTVLLKAIGLLSALTQAGVIPPVGAGTRLPVFADILADIGDEQSIEASLSTFSAHLRNLKAIVDRAEVGSLVLVDEVGSGTDPAEGAALARAILVELTRRGATTVATTHLGELKLLAGEATGVVNASLQFDSHELRPTYRLVKGMPGRSYGLAIARRLGFPTRLLDAAESELPAQERRTTQLLLELEEKDRQMAELLAEVGHDRREAERAAGEAAERERRLAEREREAERRARQQARDVLLAARQEVERAIQQFRAEAIRGDKALEEAARNARRRVEAAAARQAEAMPARKSAGGEEAPVGAGSYVRIAATGATGRVIEVRDGRATVETRGVRLDVPVTELAPEREQETASGGGTTSWSGPDLAASPEVDLRGLRAEEVAPRLHSALDAAILADLPSVRIIHGKGTGALREVVTELLKADPRIPRFRTGDRQEGGTGVTVVELA